MTEKVPARKIPAGKMANSYRKRSYFIARSGICLLAR